MNNTVAITPSKSPSSGHCCDGYHNNCAICLEAMKTPSGSIMTSCNHEFHYLCLQEAKLMKSECPLCRCPLTPPVGSNSPMMTVNFQQQHTHMTMIPREFIVRRSREAREAVQQAMTQRLERIRQGQLEIEQHYHYQQTVLQQ